MKYDVFISYSRKDARFAEQLCDALVANGVRFWIDKSIHGSDNFLTEIANKIQECKVVIFIASANSAESEWTQKEILFALKHKKTIIPYKIGEFSFDDNIELDFVFTNVQWVDSVNDVVDTLQFRGLANEVVASTLNPVSKPESVSNVDSLINLSGLGNVAVAAIANGEKEKTYNVGDYYDDGEKQGVVFDVWDEGLHGKIVSLDQVEMQWAVSRRFGGFWNGHYPSSMKVGCKDAEGMVNTQIIKVIDGWNEKFPAFAWCCKKGEDWYLPTSRDLIPLLLWEGVRKAVNQTLRLRGTLLPDEKEQVLYWTSDEYDECSAWCFNNSPDGFPDSGRSSGVIFKWRMCYVRAVAKF